MAELSLEQQMTRMEELESRLQESEELIRAIKAGEVDAFAIQSNNQSEVYTLQSGDYAYRVLIEEFGEGAVNLTEEGLIVYTNTYFFELLHLPYEKVVGTQITSFIHEDSRTKFNELFQQAKKGRSKGEINLSVLDRVIPVYISLTSLQPKLASVGIIISDLTERRKQEEVILKYQKDLEAKNRELLLSNSELDSFTYISSHDLQEPLRKIQTFSNRILDKEAEIFSATTKDYFRRILSATSRMQNLITALLNYSRNREPELTLVPLNTVLEDVKANLLELIHEHHAVIEVGPLPVLQIDYHQFIQFFSNIIINSIKYKRPEGPPVIKVGASVVPSADPGPDPDPPEGQYFQIYVADNGIGFEQQYGEKIFDPFQRLHSATKYEGTGIGLAICKKIIQNHQGLIKAIGCPGIGTTIIGYLPLNSANKLSRTKARGIQPNE